MKQIRDKAFAFIDAKRDEMLAFWENLVNMESWTGDKPNVDLVAEHLKSVAEDFGAQARLIEFPEAGNGMVAEFRSGSGKAPICFMGHYDTVFPTGAVAERPFTIKDGKAYGPGVLDMKGGVTIALYAARALKEAGYDDRTIKLVLAGDEEEGHPCSDMDDKFVEECKGAVAAFNFETGDVNGSLVVGRKGTCGYDITVKGVSVHAGREPQNGRSAILEMAHKIIDIQSRSNYDQGVTFNVGIIKGGTARNAVPDFAAVEIDTRVVRVDQREWVDQQLREAAAKTYVDGTETTLIKGTGSIAPMERTPGNDALYAYVKAQGKKTGHEIGEAVTSGGGSDSAYSVMAGVPTIDQMGVMGQWNHSDREYAVVESLFQRVKLAIDCVLDIDEFEKRIG